MSRKYTAIYVRVSTKKQDHRSQLDDLERWAESQPDLTTKWYREKASGKTMDRPAWNRLEALIDRGLVDQVVIWRLDRLGRTVSGLTQLFEKLRAQRVNLVSIRDSIDLSTPTGRLICNVLASVAEYENEVRADRVRAGQARAKAEGKTWGGSQKGRRIWVQEDQVETVRKLRAEGVPVAKIARSVGLSRPTVYRLLAE